MIMTNFQSRKSTKMFIKRIRGVTCKVHPSPSTYRQNYFRMSIVPYIKNNIMCCLLSELLYKI